MHHSTKMLLACFLLLCVVSSLLADSYGPYSDFRTTDPTGNYYVVIKKLPDWPEDTGYNGRVRYDFAKRAPGSPPVTFEETDFKLVGDFGDGFTEESNPKVRVRAGDRLLGQGILPLAPSEVIISSTGLGFVTLDVYGYARGTVEDPNSLVIVSGDGILQYRKSMRELFSDVELELLGEKVGTVHWSAGGWIDEQRECVIIVSQRPEFAGEDARDQRFLKKVDLSTGEVEKASYEEIRIALKKQNLGALPFAIDLSSELKMEDCQPELVQIFANEDLGDLARMHAAMSLVSFGDHRGKSFIKEFVCKPYPEECDLLYTAEQAIPYLSQLYGGAAPSILRDLTHTQLLRYSVTNEFLKTPSASLPVLFEMLNDDACEACQSVAIDCMGRLGTERAVPRLCEILTKNKGTAGNDYLRDSSAEALGEIGPASKPALPVLKEI